MVGHNYDLVYDLDKKYFCNDEYTKSPQLPDKNGKCPCKKGFKGITCDRVDHRSGASNMQSGGYFMFGIFVVIWIFGM